MIARLIAALLALALFVAPGHAAIRSDGTDTQHLASLLSSPGNFPASGAVTIMQWHKLNVDHDARKVLFAYHDNNSAGDGYDAIIFLTQANGTTLDINTYNDGVIGQTSAAVQTITVNTWYHYALVRNGATITLYIGSETTASMLVATVTDSTLEAQGIHWRFTATGTSAAGASADASIERVKVFAGELTLAQINNERAILAPGGTSGLRSYNPLTTAGSYGASSGSSQVTFSEQGGSNFSTVSGPSPVAVPSGAAGPRADRHREGNGGAPRADRGRRAKSWTTWAVRPGEPHCPVIERLVGATGFEPATTGPPVRCATGLRYAPRSRARIVPERPRGFKDSAAPVAR